jgi:diguanylate cyclase (GGDEF)-like protein
VIGGPTGACLISDGVGRNAGTIVPWCPEVRTGHRTRMHRTAAGPVDGRAATIVRVLTAPRMSSLDQRVTWRFGAWATAMALAYAIAARLSLVFVVQPEGIATIWPPAGLALGALLVAPRRRWPALLAGVAVAVVAANLSAGVPIPMALGFAVANTVEPLVAAAVLGRLLGGHVTLRSVREVVGLAAIAAVGSNAVTALLGAGVVALAAGAPFGSAWLTWWIADGSAMLVVAPLIITLRRLRPLRWPRVAEAASLQAAIVAFGALILIAPATPLRPFPAFLLLAWAGVRFGPPGTAVALAELAALTLVGAVAGEGPFAVAATHAGAILEAQGFVAILFGAGFLQTAAIQQREDAHRELAEERQAQATRAERLDRAIRFARDIGSTLEEDAFYQRLVLGAAAAVSADAVILAVTSLDGGAVVRAAVGAPERVGRAVDGDDGVLGRAIASAALQASGGPAPDGHPATRDDLLSAPARAVLAAPLVRGGSVVAALELCRGGERPFAADERQTLTMIAELGALALGNVIDHAAVSERSVHDALTGLPNRYYFDLAFAQVGARRARQPSGARDAVSIIFFDLDHFGVVNKERGHATGDRVLAAFGALLAARLRRADVVARYGGDEFVAILPGTDRETAVSLAGELRLTFGAKPVDGADGEPIRCTVSAGVASAEQPEEWLQTAMGRADVALAMAKRAGRNQVQAA